MSALLSEEETPITILWSTADLLDILNAAAERHEDPVKMMKHAIMEDLAH